MQVQKEDFVLFQGFLDCLANAQDRKLDSLGKKNMKKTFGLTTKIGLLEKNGVVKEFNFWCCKFARPKNGFLQREKRLTFIYLF